MRVVRLVRVALNVSDLRAACAFYLDALGFELDGAEGEAVGLAGRSQVLRRGGQRLELTVPAEPGAPYPEDTCANDLWFQHCALVTDDIAAAHARVAAFGIRAFSHGGPVTLPGGVAAWKFRDPEGHPLELIQFPRPDPATRGGIDHSAISVADAERSVRFYGELGLSVGSRQVNAGPAQDALDGLDGVTADVVALLPAEPAPHVELLGYRHPPGRRAPLRPGDRAATRLVFAADVAEPVLMSDPDGHWLVGAPPAGS